MRRRRKKNLPAKKKPDVPAGVDKKGRFPVLLALWGLAGVLFAAFVGFLELPQKINSFVDQKPRALANISEHFDGQRFVGHWTNDEVFHPSRNDYIENPDEPAMPDNGSLQLTLVENSDGSFSGELVSQKILETMHPWTAVQVEAKLGIMGGVEGVIVDGIFGKKAVLGTFKLFPKGDAGEYIAFSAPDESSSLLPRRAELWRSSGTPSGGEANPRFHQLLNAVLQERTSSP